MFGNAGVSESQIAPSPFINGGFPNPPSKLSAGDTVTVTVTNTSDSGGTFDISAVLASPTQGRTEISALTARYLSAGATGQFDFVFSDTELSRVQPGDFTLEIIGEKTFGTQSNLIASTSVTVSGGAPSPAELEKNVSLQGCSVGAPSPMRQSGQATIDLTVQNNNTVPVVVEVGYTVGGQIFNWNTVSVPASGSSFDSAQFTPQDDAGPIPGVSTTGTLALGAIVTSAQAQ